MWKLFFILKGIKPGIIVVPGVGKLNLANPKTPVQKVRQAYEAGCPYLELTEKGARKFGLKLQAVPLPDKLPTSLQPVTDANDLKSSDEEILELALRMKLVVKANNRIEVGERKYGSKKILQETEVMAEIRRQVESKLNT